jgi:tetratricopeptide (TPR) repeat protein
MECLLDRGEIEQAEAILRERDVADWLEPQDRLRLEARWAAEAAQSETLRRLLRAQNPETIQHLCRGLLTASRTWSERVQSVIFTALTKLTPQGSNDELIAIGNAFRLAGRCDSAVHWYEAALSEDASLLEAVIGRSECLREVDDRAALAIAADGFRRVAAMPRSEDPERWRSANLRLLEVLQRAGVDRSRIDARLERLRRIDPAIGGLPQS